ncbi:MAG: hypothetical protein GY711_02875 [bacterium]|nr:hypothetical protein [bacterium]
MNDVWISAPYKALGGPSAGRVYLYSGKTGEALSTYTCSTPGDTFGFDTTGLGDVDGDGKIDFLVTSSDSFVRGAYSGRAFVVSSER